MAKGIDQRPVLVVGQRVGDMGRLAVDAAGPLEAIFALVTALIDQEAPDPADRETVNQAARRPRPTLELTEDGQLHRRGGLEALLVSLACDCLDLFTSPDRLALRWCADRRCTRPFLDRSRGQRRRWCGMRGCGDRAKAATYRQRQRERLAHKRATFLIRGIYALQGICL